VARDPNVSVQMTADEFAKYQQRPKYMTQGQKTAGIITAATDATLAGVQAMMTQAQINKYKKQLQKRKKQLEKAVVDDKMLATADVQAEAVEREIDALEGSRGTVGGSGAREEIKNRARKKAQQRYANVLSGLAQAELGKRQQIADVAKQEETEMNKLRAMRDQNLIGNLRSITKDEELASLFGKAGEQDRRNRGKRFDDATGTIHEQVESNIGTRKGKR
tara:strand:+ start:158 stop:817 length:660 start_codon:yes stop_codon:yes gene_type:complete